MARDWTSQPRQEAGLQPRRPSARFRLAAVRSDSAVERQLRPEPDIRRQSRRPTAVHRNPAVNSRYSADTISSDGAGRSAAASSRCERGLTDPMLPFGSWIWLPLSCPSAARVRPILWTSRPMGFIGFVPTDRWNWRSDPLEQCRSLFPHGPPSPPRTLTAIRDKNSPPRRGSQRSVARRVWRRVRSA